MRKRHRSQQARSLRGRGKMVSTLTLVFMTVISAHGFRIDVPFDDSREFHDSAVHGFADVPDSDELIQVHRRSREQEQLCHAVYCANYAGRDLAQCSLARCKKQDMSDGENQALGILAQLQDCITGKCTGYGNLDHYICIRWMCLNYDPLTMEQSDDCALSCQDQGLSGRPLLACITRCNGGRNALTSAQSAMSSQENAMMSEEPETHENTKTVAKRWGTTLCLSKSCHGLSGDRLLECFSTQCRGPSRSTTTTVTKRWANTICLASKCKDKKTKAQLFLCGQKYCNPRH